MTGSIRDACVIAALAISANSALAAAQTCNDSTLSGSYIFYAHGTTGEGSSSSPTAYAAMIVYDGKGNAKFTASFSDRTEMTLRGVYSIDQNCKGRVTYEGGRTATYFVSPTGDDLVYVVTSGSVIASNAKRVSLEMLMKIDQE